VSRKELPVGRRNFIGSATLAATAGLGALLASRRAEAGAYLDATGWYNAKQDFSVTGDGTTDDTAALQGAINFVSHPLRQVPLFLPPGNYRITSPLNIPTNTSLIGSSLGLNFDCSIRPENCAAFNIGGATPAFHIRIQDLMVQPFYTGGPQIDELIRIDNSYSVTVRNLRVFNVPATAGSKMLTTTGAAIRLLGDSAIGGHGRCNNIIWDNLIVRNDNGAGQPPIGVSAERGCGTHRFICPDLENYQTLFKWRGGIIDWLAPYTERAGIHALNCDVDADDTAAFTTHGGVVSAAATAWACAIFSTTRRFNSYGTKWEALPSSGASTAVNVLGIPSAPVSFSGILPNLSGAGEQQFTGVSNWTRSVHFPDFALAPANSSWVVSIPANGQQTLNITVPGATLGLHCARAAFTATLGACQLSAHVSAANTVTVVAQNNSATPVAINGTVVVTTTLI